MKLTEKQVSTVLAALKDISNLRFGSKYLKVVDTNDEKLGDSDGRQGEYNTITEIYKIEDDLYIKLELQTDSYGDNESISSISLVSPVIKQIQDFVEI